MRRFRGLVLPRRAEVDISGLAEMAERLYVLRRDRLARPHPPVICRRLEWKYWDDEFWKETVGEAVVTAADSDIVTVLRQPAARPMLEQIAGCFHSGGEVPVRKGACVRYVPSVDQLLHHLERGWHPAEGSMAGMVKVLREYVKLRVLQVLSAQSVVTASHLLRRADATDVLRPDPPRLVHQEVPLPFPLMAAPRHKIITHCVRALKDWAGEDPVPWQTRSTSWPYAVATRANSVLRLLVDERPCQAVQQGILLVLYVLTAKSTALKQVYLDLAGNLMRAGQISLMLASGSSDDE